MGRRQAAREQQELERKARREEAIQSEAMHEELRALHRGDHEAAAGWDVTAYAAGGNAEQFRREAAAKRRSR